MRTVPFNSLPESEKEDFISACKQYRMNPAWFQVKAEEEPIQGTAGPIQRKVVVMHGPSGKGRRYKAGNASHWNVGFEDDLANFYYTKRKNKHGVTRKA